MRTLAAVTSLAAASPAGAVEQGAQGWLLLTATSKLGERALLYGEVQPRFDLETATTRTLLARGAVGFRATDRLSLWLGYAWTPTFSPFRNEHRPFQQGLYEAALGRVAIVNRARLEQRFIDGADGLSLRARNMLRAVFSLGDSGFGLALYDELFVNLNAPAGGPPAGLDQNRVFVGVNRPLGAGLMLEVGYLAQYAWSTVPDRLNHVGLVWLAGRL